MCLISNRDQVGGMIRVSTEDVRRAAKRTLAGIDQMRSDLRRHKIEEYAAGYFLSWRRYWRWLGFRRPTRREAIREGIRNYLFGGTIPPSFGVMMLSGHQEGVARRILRAAEASKFSRMMVTADTAEAIGL